MNNFHNSIKFTHEIENNDEIAFLDVKILRKSDETFETDVYRKKTDSSVYLNWNSFSPKNWKIGTLKGLARRAHLICSNEVLVKKELKFLKYVFTKLNGYPSKVVYKTFREVNKKIEEERTFNVNSYQNEPIREQGNNQSDDNKTEVTPHICLPYFGEQGENLLNKFKGQLRSILPNEVKPRFIYQGTKLGSFFNCKDRVSREHRSDLVYGFKPGQSDKIDYVGETNVRFGVRIHEHGVTDKRSAIYRDSNISNYEVSDNDFLILEGNYKNTTSRKIAESLYINEIKPFLNAQVKSYKLKLFN